MGYRIRTDLSYSESGKLVVTYKRRYTKTDAMAEIKNSVFRGPTYPYGWHNYNGNMTCNGGALDNIGNLKNNLPANNANGTQVNGANRPFMVFSSGQTVPMPSYYGHQQSSSNDENAPLPYVPAGAVPNFIGADNMMSAGLTGYNYSYGVPGTNIDPVRRPSWSSNDDSGHVGGISQANLNIYAGVPMVVSPGGSNQYIAGPIQPMKTQDNKGYEMINLDVLVQRHPAIPTAVPALWTNQEELSLAKCLQNPEGITNIYIRGFMPHVTDEDLHGWACRFGEIESCKAIVDQDTGKCKGFGFVLYYSPAAAENCIRGFFHLGFQASYAQKSRNARLKDLEDKSSTNIYCTGVPIEWNENDLYQHFLPINAVSTKICRDIPSGVSKEVGFARFDTRDIAEKVVKDFHNVPVESDGVKLFLRFADTKAQKQLKQQSQERRTWRSREYNYSVEHTPSPDAPRSTGYRHISPASIASYVSPAAASMAFTPATSVSPPELMGTNKTVAGNCNTWPMKGGLNSIPNVSTVRSQTSTGGLRNCTEFPANAVAAVPVITETLDMTNRTRTPSPKKVVIKIEPASGKENVTTTPR